MSLENWTKLKAKESEKHKINCKGYLLKHAAVINLFPSKSKNKKSILTQSVKLNLNKFTLKDCTNFVYNNANKPYQKTFGVNFADILVETQKELQKKATQVQKKWEKSNQAKTFSSSIEMLWNKNALERCIF